jgi:DNA helicase HerA-like ATPase
LSDLITIGKTLELTEVVLNLSMANRHGLISGATGTGKTVTLQKLAESFSLQGVPVFTADIKGDLSGLCQASSNSPKIQERVSKLGIQNYAASASPVCFWDLLGKTGLPVRTTISEFGPLLLARLMDLNEVQTGVMQIAFRVADEQGLLMLDLKDLRSLLTFVSEQAEAIQTTYGNISPATIGAIQRRLLSLEEAGADQFFGEPALRLQDIMRQAEDGRGIINVLDATKLIENSRLYSTFLLWLLSELFEELPEAGDLQKPKLVFFFDEAHLLFDDAPDALVEKIETVVRLIRSKGIGVYFITQSPQDIPIKILGQLGNRFQHALRAYTPADTKIVRAAADNFRANPKFPTETAITELEIGEALISTLDSKGIPQVVERTHIYPPSSLIGPITETIRMECINRSPLRTVYEKTIDRESAYELLNKRRAEAEEEQSEDNRPEPKPRKTSSNSNRQGLTETFLKSILRSIGNKVGSQLLRGIFGTILKTSSRR